MSAITALPEAPPDENGPRLGADVARDLGWPPSDVGLIGAAGALLDLGSKFRRTRSSMSLVRRYRERSEKHLYRAVVSTIERLSRPDP